MGGAYWYVSKAKLDHLKEATPGFFEGVSVKLEFKIPFVSGSLSGTDQSTLIRDLERVVKKLEHEQKIKSYSDLTDNEAPVMIRFEGPAVRLIDQESFWVASETGDIALLLAGSAGYAIGQPTGVARTNISPSADPVGAITAVFEHVGSVSPILGTSLSFRLSYVWQEIMRDSLESGATLPKAEGIAIFASSIPADRSQMRRVGRERTRRIVIGTPIYVRQI
ncbi:MAG TPA: hypothetical protein VG206_10075 [Terriglobia bacterium]|nr:hypothetical protein [Terriglobia bacterium]